jgi:uncharacterized protein (DUF1697 family)
MSRSVAFIRNVMVGRQGLTHDVLIDVFLAAGAKDPVSHLTTGNVSFDPTGRARDLQLAVERGLAEVIGRAEPVFIRTLAALKEDAARAPFAEPPFEDIYERCVTFTDRPMRGLELPMTTARADVVIFAVNGRDVYSVTRLVGGRPGSPSKLLERALGRRFSNRNWNTIERIIRKHAIRK